MCLEEREIPSPHLKLMAQSGQMAMVENIHITK